VIDCLCIGGGIYDRSPDTSPAAILNNVIYDHQGYAIYRERATYNRSPITWYGNTAYGGKGFYCALTTDNEPLIMLLNNHITDGDGYGIEVDHETTGPAIILNHRSRDFVSGHYTGIGDWGEAMAMLNGIIDTPATPSQDYVDPDNADVMLRNYQLNPNAAGAKAGPKATDIGALRSVCPDAGGLPLWVPNKRGNKQ